MKVTFPRLPDGQRAYCTVLRADGVRYRVHEGVAGPRVPHDLVHLTVERATGDDGGFWGAVADGAVFASMEHLDGRRPPHAARRSRDALRARAGRLQRAELMAVLVHRLAVTTPAPGPDRVRALAAETLSTLRDPAVDVPLVLAAADELRAVASHWAELTPGQSHTTSWPEHPRRPRASR